MARAFRDSVREERGREGRLLDRTLEILIPPDSDPAGSGAQKGPDRKEGEKIDKDVQQGDTEMDCSHALCTPSQPFDVIA